MAQNHRIFDRNHPKNMKSGGKEQVESPLLLGQSLQPDMRWLSTPRDRKIYLVFRAVLIKNNIEKIPNVRRNIATFRSWSSEQAKNMLFGEIF